MKKLVAFDLDGTLAESKQPLDDGMAALLGKLLDVADVAVISGGDWPQFQKQVAGRMPKDAKLEKLWLMPTTGSKLFRYQDGAWKPLYQHLFTPEQQTRIRDALTKAVKDAGLDHEKTWGEQIEDRGSQITFSGLGQEAPLPEKSKWDPDRKKRTALQKTLREALPELSINIGGSSSIDITQKDVDKAYAIHELVKHSGFQIPEMLFMGDATFPGGNDAPVPEKAGVDTITVRDEKDTETAINTVILCLK
jgi:phosphomannomutase